MTENIFEYIKILLPRHKCVTLPGLGAFILNKNEDNKIDAHRGMNPPSYSITFNSMLQHDDGTLSSYIQSLKATTYDKASKDIAIAVRDLRAKLLVNKEIPCASLGTLRSVEGVIVFTQNKAYISPIHFGLSAVGLNSIEAISQSIKKETKTISLKKKLITISASAAVVALFALSSTAITDSTQLGGNQQAGYLSSLVTTNGANYRTAENSQKQDIVIENKAAQSIVTPNRVIEAEPSKPTILSSSRKKTGRTYYLVIGGEASAERAAVTLDKFKQEGFVSARIITSAERHRIYTQSFDNMQDAEIAVAIFRQENPKYSSAWIHSAKN